MFVLIWMIFSMKSSSKDKYRIRKLTTDGIHKTWPCDVCSKFLCSKKSFFEVDNPYPTIDYYCKWVCSKRCADFFILSVI